LPGFILVVRICREALNVELNLMSIYSVHRLGIIAHFIILASHGLDPCNRQNDLWFHFSQLGICRLFGGAFGALRERRPSRCMVQSLGSCYAGAISIICFLQPPSLEGFAMGSAVKWSRDMRQTGQFLRRLVFDYAERVRC
jgi:hypothetical protein